MTVAELIAKLQECDSEAKVTVYAEDYFHYASATAVSVHDEGDYVEIRGF